MTATDFLALLSSASVEVSSRGHQLQELSDHFAPGTDVTITFLPGDNYRHNLETAAALRRAGFNPVPHIAAREMHSREALADFLAAPFPFAGAMAAVIAPSGMNPPSFDVAGFSFRTTSR